MNDRPLPVNPEFGGPGTSTDGVGTVQVVLPDTRPIVTKVLVATILAVYAVGVLVTYTTGEDWLTALGAKINDPILLGHQYYRLITVMFLHGGILHVAMNTYALWVIGQDVERFYGHGRMLVLFFLGGLTASVASLALTPGPAVGASGAVFAVFAAEMVLLYRNRELFGAGARQRLQSLVMLLVLNAAIGLLGASYIDNWAHVGGFLGGAVLAWFLVPQYRVAVASGGFGAGRLEEAPPGSARWLAPALWLGLMSLLVTWLTVRAT